MVSRITFGEVQVSGATLVVLAVFLLAVVGIVVGAIAVVAIVHEVPLRTQMSTDGWNLELHPPDTTANSTDTQPPGKGEHVSEE